MWPAAMSDSCGIKVNAKTAEADLSQNAQIMRR